MHPRNEHLASSKKKKKMKSHFILKILKFNWKTKKYNNLWQFMPANYPKKFYKFPVLKTIAIHLCSFDKFIHHYKLFYWKLNKWHTWILKVMLSLITTQCTILKIVFLFLLSLSLFLLGMSDVKQTLYIEALDKFMCRLLKCLQCLFLKIILPLNS